MRKAIQTPRYYMSFFLIFAIVLIINDAPSGGTATSSLL
jgi:hypothetical protein